MTWNSLLEVLYLLLVIEGIFLSVLLTGMIFILSWEYTKTKKKAMTKIPVKVREQESSDKKDGKLYRKIDEEMANHPNFKIRRLNSLYSYPQIREMALLNLIQDTSTKKKLPMMEEIIKVNEDDGYRQMLQSEATMTHLRKIGKKMGIDKADKLDRDTLVKAITLQNKNTFDAIFEGFEEPGEAIDVTKEEQELLGSQIPDTDE